MNSFIPDRDSTYTIEAARVYPEENRRQMTLFIRIDGVNPFEATAKPISIEKVADGYLHTYRLTGCRFEFPNERSD